MKRHALFGFVLTVASMLCATPGYAKDGADDQSPGELEVPSSYSGSCKGLPNHADLVKALKASVAPAVKNGGFDLQMWATIVDRDGFVCAVAFSGADRDDQWPGSRVISAQKAHTANAFSLDGLALSTANLYTAVQPGGSLFGLQESNPVDPEAAYKGDPKAYGTPQDGMVGKKIGGINVFGGGLGLYTSKGKVIGGLGVSGDSSCADHNVAWRVRRRSDLIRKVPVLPGSVPPAPMPSSTTSSCRRDASQARAAGAIRSAHRQSNEMALDIGAGVVGSVAGRRIGPTHDKTRSWPIRTGPRGPDALSSTRLPEPEAVPALPCRHAPRTTHRGSRRGSTAGKAGRPCASPAPVRHGRA